VLLALFSLWLLGVFEVLSPPLVSEQELATRDKEQLTVKWQTDHCPPESQRNLAEITLRDAAIADVEILDFPDARSICHGAGRTARDTLADPRQTASWLVPAAPAHLSHGSVRALLTLAVGGAISRSQVRNAATLASS
jgi:hypothetical protein